MADFAKTTWVDEVTKVGPTNMNRIEAGVDDAAEHHKSGLAANIPAANAASKNWTYFATDRGVLYANFDGATWTRVAADAAVGGVQDFMGFTLPPGFLDCDGSLVGRAVNTDLFATITRTFNGTTDRGISLNKILNVVASAANLVIPVGCPIEGPGIPAGTTVTAIAVSGFIDFTLSNNVTADNAGVQFRALPFGVGDGATTFGLPDFRGRTGIARGQGTGLTDRKLGEKGGEEAHVLTTPEIPAHAHQQSLGSFFSNTTDAGGFPAGYDSIKTAAPNGAASGRPNPITNLNTQNAGGGGGHNNMQPFIATRKIIKVW